MSDQVVKIHHSLRKGSAGWCYGAIGVILWDVLAEEDEQLTGAFRRGFKSRKLLVGCSWMYLTGHLFGAIPNQYDIIHHIGTICRRRINGRQDILRQAGNSCAQ